MGGALDGQITGHRTTVAVPDDRVRDEGGGAVVGDVKEKSSDRRWLSRLSSPLLTVLMSIWTVTLLSEGFSAITTLPELSGPPVGTD